jgi:hypothetical protein
MSFDLPDYHITYPRGSTVRSERQKAASRANLSKYIENNPSGAGLKHGARSRRVMRKWTDLRCRQGKELARILAEIEDDLGPLSPGQRVILRNVGAKLAIVRQIASWAERQPSVVVDGRLLPILGENFVTYTGAIERGIRALYELASRKPTRKTLDLSEYLKIKAEEKRARGGNGPEPREDGCEKAEGAEPDVEGEQAGEGEHAPIEEAE